jgi:hypothetical protein
VSSASLTDVTDDGEPYQQYTRTAALRIPRGLSGPLYIFVGTDRGGDVVELGGELNNVLYSDVPIMVTLPAPADIVVGTITVPQNAMPGSLFSAQFTLENRVSDVAIHRTRRQTDGVVLRFDEAIDRLAAETLSNYEIISTRRGRAVPLNSAVYDPIGRTVSIRSTRPLARNEQYRITVHDTVTDAAGNMLGGGLNGASGDYSTFPVRVATAPLDPRDPSWAGATAESLFAKLSARCRCRRQTPRGLRRRVLEPLPT